MERAGQEMHNTIEQLKAAKEYLAQKLNDAQSRIGSNSVPAGGARIDEVPAAPVIGNRLTGADSLLGSSGALRPPTTAWSTSTFGQEVIDEPNIPLNAPSRRDREGATAGSPQMSLSPSLSATEDGAGSYHAGSAVIMEDDETMQSRWNRPQSNEVRSVEEILAKQLGTMGSNSNSSSLSVDPAQRRGKRGLPVDTKSDYPLGRPFRPVSRALGGGQTHMLICALDYVGSASPLTCSIDGKNMHALARASGITDIEAMYNEQCSKEAIVAGICRTAQKCSPGDTFVFFFAGHGMSSTDYDGDEPDGKDENYVCDFTNQTMDPQKHYLSDDEFAKLLTNYISTQVNIIVISDCCHSGSVCDFAKVCWNGYNAVSISGCRDSQTSGDTGKGGICTHSIMLAIEQFQKEGQSRYSVGQLYRRTVFFDDTMMASSQDIQIEKAPGCNANSLNWPLIPQDAFCAPYNSASGLLPGASDAMTIGAVPSAVGLTSFVMPYTSPPAVIMPNLSLSGYSGRRKNDYPLGQCFRPVSRAALDGGTTHMLICALDYIGSASPLTCSIDGKNMSALAQASGITDVEAMYNEQCSKDAILAAIRRTARKCNPGDTFFFFFAGHGMSSTDYDGDEVDGKDENYVCDFTNQRMDPKRHYLSDDEFSALLTNCMTTEVNIIIVSDCCHSGSVCDFDKLSWKGYNAVSISGCRDNQTSGDTGKGGICTHSMMLAIEQLQKEGQNSYSVGQLYRKTVYFDDTMMASSQDIQFDKAPGCNANAINWPLVPSGQFTAPYKSSTGLLSVPTTVGNGAATALTYGSKFENGAATMLTYGSSFEKDAVTTLTYGSTFGNGASTLPTASPLSKTSSYLTSKKQNNHELGQPFRPTSEALGGSTTHMLICALDYLGSPSPLTCSIDGKNMHALAQASGILDVTAIYNEQCSKEAIIAAITRTAGRCNPGDTFLFFFAGHGMSSTDYDGDEPDGKDENYVCDFTNQRMDPAKHYLSDDEFANLLTRNLNKDINVIIISDCCHSGSVCDFVKVCWTGYKAVSISGCRDNQTSGDTGKGGICTHSMMLAIEQLQKEGQTDYSVGQLYRKTVYFDDTMMASSQDIQFDKAPGCNANTMTWPLIPKGPFSAPYKSASGLLPGATELSASISPAIMPTSTVEAATYSSTSLATMLAAISSGKKRNDYALGRPFRAVSRAALDGGATHMLICALDYLGSASPLTCSIDGKNMSALAQASGIADVEAMYNEQCSKEAIIAAIIRTARKCNPGDTFVFFFAGHGMSSTDYDGDEPDGKDENYVCDFTNQRMDPAQHYLSDDEFSRLLTTNLSREVNIIVVSDCCHSGSVCDFARLSWKGYNAVSISGCRDSQTSGDTGKGGICTHSMMLAIEQLQKEGRQSYSVGHLYRKTVFFDDTMMASAQDIQFDAAPGCNANSINWPLVPTEPFAAPYNSASGLLSGTSGASMTGNTAASSLTYTTASPLTMPTSFSTGPTLAFSAPPMMPAAVLPTHYTAGLQQSIRRDYVDRDESVAMNEQEPVRQAEQGEISTEKPSLMEDIKHEGFFGGAAAWVKDHLPSHKTQPAEIYQSKVEQPPAAMAGEPSPVQVAIPSMAMDDTTLLTELKAAAQLPDQPQGIILDPPGDVRPAADSVATAVASSSSSSRLGRTSDELAACREALNSAVSAATSLRFSEVAASERSNEAVDRLRAAAGLKVEDADMETIRLSAHEAVAQGLSSGQLARALQEAPEGTPSGTESCETSLVVPPWAADLKAALEVSQQRIARLEASNQELDSDRKAAHERIERLESRNRALEQELQARPVGVSAELEERLAAKDRQLESLRAHATEVTKELEIRQETLEAMESRLREAERLVLQPAPVGSAPGSGTDSQNTAPRTSELLQNGNTIEATVQNLGGNADAHIKGLQSKLEQGLDVARDRVQLLYEQLNSNTVPADSLDDASMQRLGAATRSPSDKQSLASALMAIAASISQQSRPAATPASVASGTSTPSAHTAPVLDATLPPQVVLQAPLRPAVQPASAGSSQPASASASLTLPKTRQAQVVQAVPSAAVQSAFVPSPVSVGSSMSVSTLQVASPSPSSSPQRPRTANGLSQPLAPSPPHVEVRRLKQNVDDLESLVTQMVGDKTRAVTGLEQKIAELETMVGQAGKGGVSVPMRPASLVGSVSSTATLSPTRLREVVSASPQRMSPGPGQTVLPMRSPSPAPSAGSSITTSAYIPTGTQPAPGMAAVRQTTASPSPIQRRPSATSPMRTVIPTRTLVSSRAASREPSISSSRATTPISRSGSPLPVRTSLPGAVAAPRAAAGPTQTAVTSAGGNFAWQIPSALAGGLRMNPQVGTAGT